MRLNSLMEFNLKDLEGKYELELDRIVNKINSQKAKKVLIQLPDGMKPYGPSIVDFLEEKTSATISIYLGDCFGACDTPKTDDELLVQFGHAPWK